MNRKTFVHLAVVGTAAMSLPLVNCQNRNLAMENPLAFPRFLANICDDKTILTIGLAYQKQLPSTINKEVLEKLLLINSKGKPMGASTEKSTISQMLEQKIHHDYDADNTLLINGWVLSVTEARQCALLALTYH